MAKGIGLIGNFRGKVGNMVGYNLKDSNNKQTQGVRVYQPVVKNPKTYGQAEQRAKLAPINATYRALKAIIDRGQEGKAYGNKSRLAWLSDAMKAFNGAWFEKGDAINYLSLVPLTKGSLANPFTIESESTVVEIQFATAASSSPATIGALATKIIADFPSLKAGDQITFIEVSNTDFSVVTYIESIVLDPQSTDAIPSAFTASTSGISLKGSDGNANSGAIILSREGDNGEHLRSTSRMIAMDGYWDAGTEASAKEAAIKSYMSAGTNTDWAEESLQ